MKRILIIGLGNPILGDDGVGWRIADEVNQWLPTAEDIVKTAVEVECASLGGLSLMERMIGYEKVILIDALKSGLYPVGTIREFPLAELPDPSAGHSASPHDTTLLNALNTGKTMGITLPSSITVLAIETLNCNEFSEILSPPISAAIPAVVDHVKTILRMMLDEE
ncbi:MAG: hydrogenase maturation protease [Anaerolineaceae bacterium]